MKITNFKVLILLIVSFFSLSSCSSDDSGESYGVSTGNFFPLAVNNSWKYLTASQRLLNEMFQRYVSRYNFTEFFFLIREIEKYHPF